MSVLLHPRLQALEAGFAVSELQPILDQAFVGQQLELWIKRDDLLHPIISGNKWRKLKYVLNHALSIGADTLVSMGGCHSNHLHALAYVGKCLQMQTIAYVRGEPPENFNPTLLDLQAWGMELRFVSRSDYRQLRDYRSHDALPGLLPGQYWLPEGGASVLALQGVADIVHEIHRDFDCLLVACGTGTTLAGLVVAAPVGTQVLGIAALKGGDFLHADVQQLLKNRAIHAHWRIAQDYHFGGFAKSTPALQRFMQQFETRHHIPLEPVYTGKLLFAVYDLLYKGHFKSGQRIIVLHTGGLQGVRTCN